MERMVYMNSLEKEIINLYINKLNVCKSAICTECRAQQHVPLDFIGAWFVGNEFHNAMHQPLFVGKTARGGADIVAYEDVFEISRKSLWNKSWPYWEYTRLISNRIYSDDSPEHIAFTNIVKCNNSDGIDTTDYRRKINCIEKLKVLKQEIEIIKPKEVIFYTGRNYDQHIFNGENGLFDAFNIVSDGTKLIGAKDVPWREGTACIGNVNFRLLRTGHPERKNKEDFVKAVADWIN